MVLCDNGGGGGDCLNNSSMSAAPPAPSANPAPFLLNRLSVFASIEFGDVECAVVAAINTALIASVATGPKISPLLFI
jgi:hypothetical protein